MPLLERERELAAIERALDRLAEGVGSMVLVEGPAGIGKTALLAAATDLAKERGVLVRSARGGQLEREMPFGIARQLFEVVVERASDAERERLLAGSAELALMALGGADPARTGPAGDPFAPIHGLYWLLSNLADERPVVLVVDDLHWADPQTLRFLDYLTRRLGDTSALAFAAVRSGEPDEPPQIGPLRLEAGVVRPARLSPEAVERLIAAQFSPPTAEFAAACAEATAGNPFLLAEVLRTLRADAIDPGQATAEAIEALDPGSVARYVLLRLGRFGEEAIALARAIAVLGGSPQLRHAAELAELDENRARDLCDRLREAEILAPGLPIEFVHPLVRQAVYRDLAEEERSIAHHRAAEVLAESGSGAREVAPHLLACAPDGDQWVVGKLIEAAAEAISAGALDGARSYLERALAEPAEDEIQVHFLLGVALLQLDPAGAASELQDVVDRGSDTWVRFEALRLLAVASFFAGSWERAAASFAAALDVLGDQDQEQRLITEAHLYTSRAAALGLSSEDSKRIRALAEGATATTQGECLVRQAFSFERLLDHAPVDQVIELAASSSPPPWEPTTIAPTLGLGIKVLAWCGAWDLGREMGRRFLDWAREGGRPVATSYAMTFVADVDRQAGRLAEADAEARAALDLARELSPDQNFAIAAAGALLAVLVARGDLDEAEQLTREVELPWSVLGHAITPWPLEVRGYLRLAQGALEAGVQDLLDFGREVEDVYGLSSPVVPWRQEAAPALAALDRTAEAKELIDVAEERARSFGAAHVIGTVLRARGLIEPKARQVETLRESVAALEEYGPPHELARSLVELGAALRRSGQRADSREPLRRALELAVRSGAGGTEQRAREELAAAGSRPRSAFRTGVASLTASELRAAKLAAEGLSNVEIAQRLFVTRKTVEKHLSNAYGKLEISSREELPGALREPTET